MYNINMETLGSKIYNLRRQAKMSQEELADKLGVTRQSVSNWETDNLQPRMDKLKIMCEIFGVSLSYFLPYIAEKEEEVAVAEKADNSKDRKLLVVITVISSLLAVLLAVICVVLAVICFKILNPPAPTTPPPDGGYFVTGVGTVIKAIWPPAAGIIVSLILLIADLIYIVRLRKRNKD